MSAVPKAFMTFILKDAKAKVPTLIFMIVRIEGNSKKRLKYSTGEKVHPDYWDKKSMAANPSPGNGIAPAKGVHKDELKTVNTVLNRFREIFSAENNYCVANEVPFDLEKFRYKLDERFKNKPAPEQSGIFLDDFAKGFIYKSDRKPNTLKAYNNMYNTILDYQNTRSKRLRFDDITLDFYDDFFSFLTNTKGYALNTVGTRIKNLKVLMASAYDLGLHNNQIFKNKRFKKVTEDTDNIYLSEADIAKLWEKDFSENKRLEKVRDLFLVGCRTGLRFGDLHKVGNEAIAGSNVTRMIKIRTEKTGQLVAIPLHWQVDQLLEKYNGQLPKSPSNQKFNDYLKEVGEHAKIKEPVIITRRMKGMDVSTKYNKFELISSHTARRTFASLGYLAGIPVPSLMLITGHRTTKAFFSYLKITAEESAALIANNPFFLPPLKVAK